MVCSYPAQFWWNQSTLVVLWEFARRRRRARLDGPHAVRLWQECRRNSFLQLLYCRPDQGGRQTKAAAPCGFQGESEEIVEHRARIGKLRACAQLLRLPTPISNGLGDNKFGKKAEDFARFFGTPTFLVAQTIIVAIWIWVNVIGWKRSSTFIRSFFSISPFHSQAAYAAPPLILLAQTRQADRDKANSIADAEHREELHRINDARRAQLQQQSTDVLIEMIAAEHHPHRARGDPAPAKPRTDPNGQEALVERIDAMTTEVHTRLAQTARG